METNKHIEHSVKPLATLAEKYADPGQWVTCKTHFGVHHERVTCEAPKCDAYAVESQSEVQEQKK